jgi:hypothetical protein
MARKEMQLRQDSTTDCNSPASWVLCLTDEQRLQYIEDESLKRKNLEMDIR